MSICIHKPRTGTAANTKTQSVLLELSIGGRESVEISVVYGKFLKKPTDWVDGPSKIPR